MTRKTQKKLRKLLTLVSCAVLLVCVTVVGTVAYLTSTASVTNTFSVGKVNITLDETDVDNSTEGENDRDTANAYKLMPGQSYIKDPIVHVSDDSETSWLFVKVQNNIAAIEDTTNTIAAQIAANSWSKVEGTDDIYAYANPVSAGADINVFSSFKISDSVNNATLATYNDKTIVVTAYAVQQEGFANATDAWNATFGAPQQPTA